MQYCANCGAPVEGRFCPKCGAAVAAGAAPAEPPPPGPGSGPAYVPPGPSAQGLGMEENLAAALCYIPIVGLIFLLIEPYNKNRTIRFHAWQSLFYAIAWFVIMIALGIFSVILRVAMPFGMWAFWALLLRLVQLALFAGLIFAAVKAYQKQRLFFPVIGPLAEKQA